MFIINGSNIKKGVKIDEIKPFDIKNIVDQILDMLISTLKIIPPVFRRDLATKIEADLHEEFANALI